MRPGVLLLAEGSGGHLLPALETASRLAALDFDVELWYAERPHTRALIERAAEGVVVRGFPALACGLTAVGRALRLGAAVFAYLDRNPRTLVVGFGGRFSMPGIAAARLSSLFHRGVRILLHEQNCLMGRANRWMARLADHIALSFPQTLGVPKGCRTTYTGLPVRAFARSSSRGSGAADSPWTVLIVGGSQGSRSLNRMLSGMLQHLSPEEKASWRFIHLAGSRNAAGLRAAYAKHGAAAEVHDFYGDMQELYDRSDLVIGRAGASTLAEMALCGLPAVLIPYPFAENHQLYNARHYESCGGAYVMLEQNASPENVLGILRLLKRDRALRLRMAAAMRQAALGQATANLIYLIGSLAGQTGFSTESIAAFHRAPSRTATEALAG